MKQKNGVATRPCGNVARASVDGNVNENEKRKEKLGNIWPEGKLHSWSFLEKLLNFQNIEGIKKKSLEPINS